MSDDISNLLGGLLSNPEGIRNLISGLTQGKESLTEDSSKISLPVNTTGFSNDRRISLLRALKPYLRSSRANSIDKAIQFIRLAKLTENLRNEGK